MNTQRPPPGRRRLMAFLTITLALLIPSISAQPTNSNQLYHQQLFHEYAARGEIHVDTKLLHRRQDTSSSAPGIATATSLPPSAATSVNNPDDSSPLPTPFDTSLGNNFTTNSCPTFFNNFLTNSTFQQCTPLSLLLQNSQAFMTTQRSPTLMNKLLATSCSAPISICAATLTDIARQLTLDSACGADFRARQPLVIQAYNGLLGYEPIATTACLRTPNYNGTSPTPILSDSASDGDNEDEDDYCFASAIANKANPSDPFPYYTAIGMNLPSVARPTCNGCLKASMATFARWALKADQPLSLTYLSCARTVEETCGSGFADTGVRVGSEASGSGMKNTAVEETSGAVAVGARGGGAWWLVGVMGLLVVLA